MEPYFLSWLATDFRAYVKSIKTRWDLELRYYKDITAQGETIESVKAMDHWQFDEFRKKSVVLRNQDRFWAEFNGQDLSKGRRVRPGMAKKESK